jgi:hypothetical protein
MPLTIGAAFVAMLLLLFFIVGCFFGVFYALKKKFPEKFYQWFKQHQEHQETIGEHILVTKS